MSTLAVNTITNAAGGNTAQINGMTPTAQSLQGFRNRIINGDMRIDQRNAGASVNPSTGAYTLDRWDGGGVHDGVLAFQRVTDAPAEFSNSFRATVSTADATLGATQYARFGQMVEGFNSSDLAWGTASAKSITLSFWVKASLTGTFGGYITNSAENRWYVFSYTISSANTWEQKTITITGDTSGTWLTNNGIGLRMYFSLGAGSSFTGTAGAWGTTTLLAPTGQTNVLATLNATWQITGVQLEAGSVATPFERRPYGTELALCQRYYYKTSTPVPDYFTIAWAITTTACNGQYFFPVSMRVAPPALEQTGTAGDYRVRTTSTNITCSSVPSFGGSSETFATVTFTVASGLTGGQGLGQRPNSANAFLAWSAEL
jgi:hypothetical protein